MIPLKDDLRTRRTPYVTIALIAANLAVFLIQLGAPQGFDAVVWAYGAVPFEIWHLRDLPPHGLVAPPFTVLTSMFMHGGVAHLAFNMLFLWIFGNDIEDAVGGARFLVFYLLAGIAAAAAQVLVSGPEVYPMVGASGAIAGVLGAYLLLYPRARVLAIVPIFIFVQFVWLPASVFLVVWFVVQIISSLYGGSIAWYAHIGGFLAGLALIRLFLPSSGRYAYGVRRYRWS